VENSILRLPIVEARTGFKRSAIYERIAGGLFVRPIKLGARAVGWPSHEVAAIVGALVAGKSNDEIRAIVTRLEAARLSSSQS
jgi:prophage regulatory protein